MSRRRTTQKKSGKSSGRTRRSGEEEWVEFDPTQPLYRQVVSGPSRVGRLFGRQTRTSYAEDPTGTYQLFYNPKTNKREYRPVRRRSAAPQLPPAPTTSTYAADAWAATSPLTWVQQRTTLSCHTYDALGRELKRASEEMKGVAQFYAYHQIANAKLVWDRDGVLSSLDRLQNRLASVPRASENECVEGSLAVDILALLQGTVTKWNVYRKEDQHAFERYVANPRPDDATVPILPPSVIPAVATATPVTLSPSPPPPPPPATTPIVGPTLSPTIPVATSPSQPIVGSLLVPPLTPVDLQAHQAYLRSNPTAATVLLAQYLQTPAQAQSQPSYAEQVRMANLRST